MSRLHKQPLTIEYALLGLLYHQPMHPYELHQRVLQTEVLHQIWNVKQSQLYALIVRLEEEGLISSTLEPQANRPPRKMLSLTAQGSARLLSWMGEPVPRGRDFRQEFLAKLYTAAQPPHYLAEQLIHTQRAACREWLVALETQYQQSTHQPYDQLVVSFRISQIQAIMAWLEQCEQLVVSETKAG